VAVRAAHGWANDPLARCGLNQIAEHDPESTTGSGQPKTRFGPPRGAWAGRSVRAVGETLYVAIRFPAGSFFSLARCLRP
jgi:hypothetical protein